MIDEQGFRANVGIILANGAGQVLWARRFAQNAWQFPQGGMRFGETPEQAMYRELHEEIGLHPQDVEIVAHTQEWLRYRLPKHLQRRNSWPLCVGQKQKWFLLRHLSDDSAVRLDMQQKPEFDHWRWVNYWYPMQQVVPFKRNVYLRALKELSLPHRAMVQSCQC